jgi:hypothetical protein
MSAGDFALGSTFDVKFTTRQVSGAPFTLAGSPAVAAYPDNSTGELTAGITLTVDFDSRTGLNNVRVVATTGNGYATGTSYALVITAGTVNGVSVVGEVVEHFTLDRAASLNALTVDTYAEPGQETPAATTTLAKKISYLYKGFRNRLTQDATTVKLYADDGTTVDQKATVSDDGVSFDRGEFGTGP